ncbi:hypothetical protein BVI434_1660035 [Burkholderia vietnamiensis]|nr:hypothetical protein BVI434_1660035 [Burkholderia vietnamiensis]
MIGRGKCELANGVKSIDCAAGGRVSDSTQLGEVNFYRRFGFIKIY